MPIREGGLGLTSAYEVMIPAYIASHGSVIRELKKTRWPESSAIAQVVVAKTALEDCIDQFNTSKREAPRPIRCDLLDPARPDLWPTQKILSSAVHHMTADELEEELIATDPTAAGLFISWRREGAGDFLRVIPSLHTFSVSPQLFRVQIAMRIGADVPALSFPTAKCV